MMLLAKNKSCSSRQQLRGWQLLLRSSRLLTIFISFSAASVDDGFNQVERISHAEYLDLKRNLRESCEQLQPQTRPRTTSTAPSPSPASSAKRWQPPPGTINRLFDYHGSDRGFKKHMYGTSYDYLFTASVEARCGVRRLLEIGIGSVNPASPGHMLEHRDRADDAYSPGPSLRVWRDVFPNAEIFGFDIDPDAMIHGEPRIQTFTVDTVNKTQVDLFFYEQFDWDYESYAKARWGRAARNRANYSEVIYRPSSADPSSTSLAVAESVGVQPPSAGTAFTVLDGEEGRYREDLEEVPTRWDRDAVPTFDIIIDDGLHVPLANDASMSFLWPYLSRNNGLYVIEDLDGHLTEQAAHYRAKFDQRFTPVMMIVQGTTVASNIIALRKTVRSPGHVPVTAAQLDPKNQLHPRHCWNRLDFAQSDWEGEAVNRTFENCCLGSPNAASRKLCYKPTDAHPNWEADFYSHNIAGSNWLELFYMATLCCAPRIVARTKDVHILKYFHVPSVEDRFFGTSGGAGGGSKNFGSSRGDTVVSAGTRLM